MVFKKITFQNRYVALETPSRPLPPFMANAILNFHFDYWHTSLSIPSLQREAKQNDEHIPSDVDQVKISFIKYVSLPFSAGQVHSHPNQDVIVRLLEGRQAIRRTKSTQDTDRHLYIIITFPTCNWSFWGESDCQDQILTCYPINNNQTIKFGKFSWQEPSRL